MTMVGEIKIVKKESKALKTQPKHETSANSTHQITMQRAVILQSGINIPQNKSKSNIDRKKRKIWKQVTVEGSSVKNTWKSTDIFPPPIFI